MAGGKETPRQKMIGMMYLVLTALLAMNVSKEILNSFVIVNEGLIETNEGFQKKNEKTYLDFEAAKAKDPAKTQPYFERAMQAKKVASSLDRYIDDLKKELIMKTDKKDEKAADTLAKKMMGIDSKDNYDIPSEIMIGSDPSNPKDGPFTAKELKRKINEARTAFIKLFDDTKLFLPGDRKEMENKIGLKTADFGIVNGTMETWETGNFEHVPLAAVITILSKLQADIKNAEADVSTKLFSAVSGKDFKFDQLVAKVIAPSSYILAGDEYKADVLLVAYSSTTHPTVLLGPVDTTKKGEGVNPLVGGGDSTKVKVESGTGKYTVQTGAEGLQKWSGVIKVEKPGGGFNYYPFTSEYMVAKPAAAVSPDKMNVFYIGVDNPVTISAAGVAPENLSPSVSGGTISGSKGKYIVRVTGGAEATVNVGAKFGSTSKPMGSFKFRVKRVPPPVASVAGKEGDDVISKAELQAVSFVAAKLKNFDFELKFDVVSFEMTMMFKGSPIVKPSSSARLTEEMKSLLSNAGPGTRVYFENVKAKGPDGAVIKIPPVNLKVK